MATYHTSAGAFVRELDLSQYQQSLAYTIFACPFTATKGPMNVPTFINSEEELVRVFGPPGPGLPDFGLYGAIQYLKRGNQFVGSRVGDGTETNAEVTLVNGADSVLNILAMNPGTWGNGIRVTLANGSDTGRFNLTVEAVSDLAGTYTAVELYQDVSLDATDSMFIENVLANGVKSGEPASQYIRAEVIDGTKSPTLGTFNLTGGTDGLEGVTPATYVGTKTGSAATGLQAFANPERVDLNLLACPGVSDYSVCKELISIAESRRDCLALIDPPRGLTPTGIVDWHNGGDDPDDKLISSYAALFGPWGLYNDPYTQSQVWLPPSGRIAGAMAESELAAHPWSAAAGYNRGKLADVLKLEWVPDLDQRDLMYGLNGNAVNPIAQFSTDGVVIWGDRTLQRTPSAVDRISARRGVLYITKQLATLSRYMCFEPNDATMWDSFKAKAEQVLDWVKGNRGVYDYGIECDENTTTQIDIDNHRFRARVWIQPTKTAEQFWLDIILLPTGAQITDYSDLVN